jgi:hypothetical protein
LPEFGISPYARIRPMRNPETELNLPCKLAWVNGVRSEVRGKVVQLSSSGALAILDFGLTAMVPSPGTAVEVEVLLPENTLTVLKCIRAKGRIERTTELGSGSHLVACRLSRTAFKDCTDSVWLKSRAAGSGWKM